MKNEHWGLTSKGEGIEARIKAAFRLAENIVANKNITAILTTDGNSSMGPDADTATLYGSPFILLEDNLLAQLLQTHRGGEIILEYNPDSEYLTDYKGWRNSYEREELIDQFINATSRYAKIQKVTIGFKAITAE